MNTKDKKADTMKKCWRKLYIKNKRNRCYFGEQKSLKIREGSTQ